MKKLLLLLSILVGAQASPSCQVIFFEDLSVFPELPAQPAIEKDTFYFDYFLRLDGNDEYKKEEVRITLDSFSVKVDFEEGESIARNVVGYEYSIVGNERILKFACSDRLRICPSLDGKKVAVFLRNKRKTYYFGQKKDCIEERWINDGEENF